MEQSDFFTIPSPCVGVCQIGEQGYCKGCFRSRDERFHWTSLSNAEKRSVIEKCRKRYSRLLSNRNFAKDIFDEAVKHVEVSGQQFELNFDSDIRDELGRAAIGEIDLSNVSDKTIDFLYWFLKVIFWPVVASMIASVLLDSIDELSSRFAGMNTEQEVIQEIKKIPNISKYKNLWVISVNNLNFREGPSISDVVITQLHTGDIVDVIDSEYKNWLNVRTSVNGELVNGWIVKKYAIEINTN
ncbi:DUF1289 domain-containing protein [Photobacterium ganghwense]|uniref:DUF1289 domain-containing protein n=1 Tax=Photobacterium ganghwense TaxID=320778 RepID=UPI0040579785